MLVPTKISEQATVRRLFELWTERYSVNLQGLDLESPSTCQAILEACSIQERIRTGTKFPNTIVKFKSQLAGLQARVLYQYAPDEVDLEEVSILAESIHLVYLKLLQVYTKESEEVFREISDLTGINNFSLSSLGLPDLEEVLVQLQPILLECQDRHMESRDWRTLGFLTTQFSIANNLLLDDPHLSRIEKRLLMPYFTFVEEQVAMPWQRVCIAASKYELDDPLYKIVEQMLPMADVIAFKVNNKLVNSLPEMVTRRGKLNSSLVSHSCLRDLSMFQTYLWLSLLEKNMTPVQEELILLCIMVLPSMKIKWPIIAESLKFLAQEIINYLTPNQIEIVEPYLIQSKEIFAMSSTFFEVQ